MYYMILPYYNYAIIDFTISFSCSALPYGQAVNIFHCSSSFYKSEIKRLTNAVIFAVALSLTLYQYLQEKCVRVMKEFQNSLLRQLVLKKSIQGVVF